MPIKTSHNTQTLSNGHSVESFGLEWVEEADDDARAYWLSFADEDDGHHLGACLVRVTGADVNAIALELMLRFPQCDGTDGPWFAAAIRKTHNLKINPGGQVAGWRVDQTAETPVPENVLLSKEQLKELGIQ